LKYRESEKCVYISHERLLVYLYNLYSSECTILKINTEIFKIEL